MNNLQNIWVTGAAGFTGKYLLAYLLEKEKDKNIIAIDINKVNKKSVISFAVDLYDYDELLKIFNKFPPFQVYHLAGIMPPSDINLMWKVNVGSTVNLFKVITLGQENIKILNVGSAAEYFIHKDGFLTESDSAGGNNTYGMTKWTQTQIALTYSKNNNLNIKIARPFNLIGPGLSTNLVVGKICNMLIDEKYKNVVLMKINSKRDFIDVRDAVAAYWKILNYGKKGSIYNVCTGKATCLKDIYEVAKEVANLNKSLIVECQNSYNEPYDIIYGNNKKIINELDWHPEINLRETILDMIHYIKKNYENK